MYDVEIEKTTNRADDEVQPNWHMQKSWAMYAVDRDVTPRVCHTFSVFSVLLTRYAFNSQQFFALICISHCSSQSTSIDYLLLHISLPLLARLAYDCVSPGPGRATEEGRRLGINHVNPGLVRYCHPHSGARKKPETSATTHGINTFASPTTIKRTYNTMSGVDLAAAVGYQYEDKPVRWLLRSVHGHNSLNTGCIGGLEPERPPSICGWNWC